jgi:hypothetical protein
MKRYPDKYPNQTAIGKVFGLSFQSISVIINAYQEVEAVKSKVPSEISNRLEQLPPSKIRPSFTVKEDLKCSVLSETVDKDLTQREAERLAKTIKEQPNATSEVVKEEAQRIADERAQRYIKDADREIAKNERNITKVISDKGEFSEPFIKACYGHLSFAVKGKTVASEKVKSYAVIVADILLQRAIAQDELDSVFAEADGWK